MALDLSLAYAWLQRRGRLGFSPKFPFVSRPKRRLTTNTPEQQRIRSVPSRKDSDRKLCDAIQHPVRQGATRQPDNPTTRQPDNPSGPHGAGHVPALPPMLLQLRQILHSRLDLRLLVRRCTTKKRQDGPCVSDSS